MNIAEVQTDKKRYLPLLLLGDEDEQMLGRYLARGVLLVGFSEGSPSPSASIPTRAAVFGRCKTSP